MKYCYIVTLLPIFLFFACSLTPTGPGEKPEADHLTISMSVLNEDSIVFTYTTGSNRRFILPYHFFDNPIEPTSGSLLRDLSIVDANGTRVDTISETGQFGHQTNTITVIPETAELPVTITYRLNLSNLQHDENAKMMPAVHIRDTSLFLIGAYCLILPQTGNTLAGLWRTPHIVEVSINAPAALPLYGIPSKSFTCANNYELMFLQLCAGHTPVAHGWGGSTEFVFIDYLNTAPQAGKTDSLSAIFASILGDITSVFGHFSSGPYTVSFQNIWGGLEGTFGFSIGEAAEGAGSRFGEILAHEALHNFVGVHCGEYDDTWWKESAAAWLGLETAVRLGYYEKNLFRERMTKRFDLADTVRFQRALSDQQLRGDLFPDTLHGLVYERGAQVMMLLDVSIRRGSGGSSTLGSATADICRRFSGSAFNRADFISTLEHHGARDAQEIFAAYVDTPDSVMTEAMLMRTFEVFDSLAGY